MSTRACSALLTLVLGGCGLTLRDSVPVVPAAVAPPPASRPATGSIWAAAPARLELAADRRARRVGDLLTIVLVERTEAQKSAAAEGNRQSARQFDLSGFAATDPVSRALEQSSASEYRGEGRARQANRLTGEFTVTVTEVLPNGVLRVAGDRRLVLARGEEQLQLTGLVRPEDIDAANRVPSTRVADARIRFTGTGEIAAQIRQGWFHRFFDRISPL
ncbi:MAG: flagellar basal body L-ring protein FlgH [Sphingomonadaceae bacterium]|uniref:flagellar basal body L-ring protein FlgH n=1 Tax=Thermaurantiacus sp. TaxID=2820283 RepID=UPI00298EFC6D|nr:flagellar basal body L-ring protein FlgH [Thermaurantiacus sp.]MCS6985896.1 flagellar basal body L-ring protein FlgH [Sphingomonadaceae bacterium]MDW8414888.1 flagellar basal body L-ring protein FlgH [Thermaurantiacus sp.]